MEAKRRRRGWGWFFVVLFLIELLAFGFAIGHDFLDAVHISRIWHTPAKKLYDGVIGEVLVGFVVLTATFTAAFFLSRTEECRSSLTSALCYPRPDRKKCPASAPKRKPGARAKNPTVWNSSLRKSTVHISKIKCHLRYSERTDEGRNAGSEDGLQIAFCCA
jgi:hypothetical protein